jgi:hypothetical protein
MNDESQSIRPDPATLLLSNELRKNDTPENNALAMVLENQSVLAQELIRNTEITKRTEEQAKRTNGRVSAIEALKLPEVLLQHKALYNAFLVARTFRSAILLASPIVFGVVAVVIQKVIDHFWK